MSAAHHHVEPITDCKSDLITIAHSVRGDDLRVPGAHGRLGLIVKPQKSRSEKRKQSLQWTAIRTWLAQTRTKARNFTPVSLLPGPQARPLNYIRDSKRPRPFLPSGFNWQLLIIKHVIPVWKTQAHRHFLDVSSLKVRKQTTIDKITRNVRSEKPCICISWTKTVKQADQMLWVECGKRTNMYP